MNKVTDFIGHFFYIIRFCFLEQRNTMYGKRQIEGGTYGTIKNKKDVDLVESL